MLVKERLEKQVQGCLFVEEVSNSYAGFKVTVITKDSIEWIKKELSDEYKLVQNFGTYLLGSNSVDTLIHHWAKGRIYQRNKGMSVSKKTYPVRDAINLLKSYNQSHINHPKDCLKLIEFAMSLVEKKTKVITFGMDTESYDFLISKEQGSHDKFKDGKVSSTTKTQMIALLAKVFYALGTKYQPVRITSGFRTVPYQCNLMTDMLEWIPNIADYYTGLNGTPYFEWMQKMYLGTIDPIPNTLSSAYKIQEQIIIDQNINDPNMNELEKIEKTFKGNSKNINTLLLNCINNNVFWSPSHHTTGHAFDISTASQYKDTAVKVYETHKPKSRLTTSSKNPHVHLTLN